MVRKLTIKTRFKRFMFTMAYTLGYLKGRYGAKKGK